MFCRIMLAAGVVFSLAACSTPEQTPQPNDQPPNIVLILVDDLGIADLALYGGEIATPNLQRLADQGVHFSNFQVGAMCSPTRAMLLTGVDQHLTGYGTMAEFMTETQRGQPGYEGYLNDRVITLATWLRAAGYNTYMTGKWHLGIQSLPSTRGFEQTWILVDGAASHYDAQGYGEMRPFARFRRNGTEVTLPDGFYSSDFYTDELIRMIGRERTQPFFGYLAFTAPHWPLHAPKENTAKYAETYQVGWDEIRRRRFVRMQELGLIAQDAPYPARLDSTPAWDTLSPEQKIWEARMMAVYAGMVDRIDENVGKLIAHLEAIGEMDNTIFVFLSDNGPEAVDFARNAPPLPEAKRWLDAYFDNSDPSTLGGPTSYPFYGERWAHVSAAPHRYYKTVVTQGGIHVPLIISWPGRIAHGTRIDQQTSVVDITPTLLAAAGVPATTPDGLHPISGHNLLPVLQGTAQSAYPPGTGHGYELFGNEAYIMGDWKVLRLKAPRGDGTWALYNIAQDPGETRDLSDAHPDKKAALLEAYARYAARNNVILPPDSYTVSPDEMTSSDIPVPPAD